MPEISPDGVTPFVFSDPTGKRWPRLRLVLFIGAVLFFVNADPYSYASLQQHASQITHLCPEWMTVIDGMGDLQIDADGRLPKLTANNGIALMPLLTNLVGDTWQPEAIENLAHGPEKR